jgi:hypothetical protein
MERKEKDRYIAEEVYLVQHGGEIPEVAYHGSLYYLTDDPDGPGLNFDPKDIHPLKQAVVSRYQAIIRRDLDPDNRDKREFRGLARCAVNWQRLVRFCMRENIAYEEMRAETAAKLREFLQRESADVRSGVRSSSINCSSKDIDFLVKSLGLTVQDMPERWQELCPDNV